MEIHYEAHKVEALGSYTWHWPLPKVLNRISHEFLHYFFKEAPKIIKALDLTKPGLALDETQEDSRLQPNAFWIGIFNFSQLKRF